MSDEAIRGTYGTCYPGDYGKIIRVSSLLPCAEFAVGNENAALGGNGACGTVSGVAGTNVYHSSVWQPNTVTTNCEIIRCHVSTGPTGARGGYYQLILAEITADGNGWQTPLANVPRTPSGMANPQMVVRWNNAAIAYNVNRLCKSILVNGGDDFDGDLWNAEIHGGPLVIAGGQSQGFHVMTRTITNLTSNPEISVCWEMRTPASLTTRYA